MQSDNSISFFNYKVQTDQRSVHLGILREYGLSPHMVRPTLHLGPALAGNSDVKDDLIGSKPRPGISAGIGCELLFTFT